MPSTTLFALLATLPGLAQPGPFLHADLQYAAHVCTDTTYTTDAVQVGVGNVADLGTANRGCLVGNEGMGVWMHFQAATAGRVGFTVAPAQPADYDFAVWGPFTAPPWTLETPPVRCSYSALNGAGGLNYTAVDLSEGAGGDGWVRYLDVLPGEWYVLYVDHFPTNGLDLSLTWQLQAGATLACLQPPGVAMEVPAGPLLPGGTASFSDQSTYHPYAWYWEFPTGLPTSSLERDPQDIVFTEVGCHAVQLTVYNAAGSSTTNLPCGVVVEVSTGLDAHAPVQFAIRQGPTELRIVAADTHQRVEVQLLDASGRSAMRVAGSGEQVLNTAALSPGRYTVVVVQGGARSAQAVVLHR
jgi:hypothetical protein